ncbi:MAG: hypothetical protein Q9191_001237, partial [Dirinaria sp. TL-2023a]
AQPMKPPKGPPYASKNAGLGGQATVDLDVPVTSVFMFLFLLGGIGHMTVLQLNLRRGRKFPMSGAMTGFSLARILACSMRIVWATKPTDVSIAITAQILLNLGDLIGFVVNLNFALRIIRALHPKWGWHRAFKWFYIVIYCLMVATIFILIGFSIDGIYTLDPQKLQNSRDGTLYGLSYFAFTSILSLFLIALALILPRKTEPEQFGRGGIKTKVAIATYGGTLLALGAWFRAGTNYMPPHQLPLTKPVPYLSKACFYVFYFTLEVLVIWGYLLARIDRVFYVPDGSKGPGDYSKSRVAGKDDSHAEDGQVENETEEVKSKGTESQSSPATEVVDLDGKEPKNSSATEVVDSQNPGAKETFVTEVVDSQGPEAKEPSATEVIDPKTTEPQSPPAEKKEETAP